MKGIEVTGLFVYPVKGLRGVALEESVLQSTGFAFDRHWMVIMPNGRMVSQRQMPLMSCITTHLSGGQLIISAASEPDLIIEINKVPNGLTPVIVWKDTFEALDEGETASAWFSRVLASKYPLRLVRMAADIVRPQSKPDLLGSDTSTHFADAAPFLLVSESSLGEVNTELAKKDLKPMPMNRFRPNIIVKGIPAFKEYEKGTLKMITDEYQFSSCYPCERCVVTTVDQSNGIVDKSLMEPLKTLQEMQTAPGYKGAYFGQNIILANGVGEKIRLGDQLIWE